ncbi:MAG: response regulator [Deltaproteobacteria bacterium]|nr:response regulator [Deltaproteobacteria bacterium]
MTRVQQSRTGSAESCLQKINILAVDDETLNNELLQRTFRAYPQYDVHVATSAADALVYLAAGHQVHVLLVDQSMPQMSGTEFVREIHKRGYKPQVIMVTAFPELKEVIDMWQEGLVRGIVPKPWRALDLVRTVDRFASKL